MIVLVLTGYFGLARMIGNLYPFSTFPMYSGSRNDASASRIVVRTPDGKLEEVDQYVAWSCDASLDDVGPARCPELEMFYNIPYIDRELLDYVEAHSASDRGGESVELVRQVWRFPDGPGSPRGEACVLARCRVRRK